MPPKGKRKNKNTNESIIDEEVFESENLDTLRTLKKKKVQSQQSQSFYCGSEDDTDNAEGADEFTEKTATEAGQILEVHLEDFMCHRKCTVKFDRHLNFITGRNGSGLQHL
jgi:hypothetical protein